MIGEALATACVEPAVLARLAGPLGQDARRAAAELAQLDAGTRRARRAAWTASARAPLPPGLRGVEASWIEAALAGLPARARDALGGGTLDAVSVWLARWACAALPPLPPSDPAITRPRSAGEAIRMAPAALRAWLEEVGADQLAFALGEHAGQAAAALDDRVAAAAARITRPPRAGELGTRRAAIARARVEPDGHALLRVGARALAPHVSALERRQLAVRLPREVGVRVLAELGAHARSALAAAPSWRALAAV